MAIKKSELYSSLWKSCDELRGSMDASQYKDYVLVLLFMKYVSDKGGDLVDIPEGGSFEDMKKLKGQSDIGDKINKIIGELAKANDLNGIITVADFNDDEWEMLAKDKKLMAKETRLKADIKRLTERIKELAVRYETPMPKLTDGVADLTSKVENHLKKMGYKL